MNDRDNEDGRGGNSTGDNNTPAADFGRRRVTGVLRRERPRLEQGDETQFEVHHAIEKAMKEPQKGLVMWSPNRKSAQWQFLLFCRWRTTCVIATTHLSACWKAKKRGGANLNSRYLGRPQASGGTGHGGLAR